MRRVPWLFFILCSLGCSSGARAHYFFFTNYTVDDGLSDPYVSSIVRDHEGFLWVATENGLNKFNGSEFVVYKSMASDTTSLPIGNIRNVFVDHKGRLWVSTFWGICLYDRSRDHFRRLSLEDGVERLSAFENLEVFEDSRQRIWAGSKGIGLLRYDEERRCFVRALPRNVMSDRVADILEDDGLLWFISSDHLVRFHPDSGTTTFYKYSLPQENKNRIQAMKLFKDPFDDDVLWIGSWGSGLLAFSRESGKFVNYKFQKQALFNLGNIVFDIYPHDEHTLWLATNAGIQVFDKQKKSFGQPIRDSIHEKTVANIETYCIYPDKDGILWFGTRNGLCNINPAKQNFLNHPLWMGTLATHIVRDTESGKYYGLRFYSERSLLVFDPGTGDVKTYAIPGADELRAEPFALFKDSRGLVWIGTTRGLYTFREAGKEFRLYEIEKQLQVGNRELYVTDITEDASGTIWFTSYAHGLFRVDANTQKCTVYRSVPGGSGLQVSGISRVLAGSGNNIYVLGENNGIAVFHEPTGTFKTYLNRQEKYAPLAGINDMKLDREQSIWLTTKNNGLLCIRQDGTLKVFLKDEYGNIVDQQQSLVVDTSQKIWLTSSNGIYRFDPVSETFRHYTLQDGFPARTVSGTFDLQDDGSIAYDFAKGLFKFYPSKMTEPALFPKVHLTAFSVNGKTTSYSRYIDELDTIRLDYSENNIAIAFNAINFSNSAATLFSSLLENTDGQWSSPQRTRTINFMQLPPGNYKLRIRAGTTPKQDAAPEKVLYIEIIPAWWQTTWFRMGVLFLVLAALVFIVRFFLSLRYKQKIARLERQQEIEAIRSKISRDIHDEIGSGLTKIKLMSRSLLKKAESAGSGDLPGKISAASDELIQNMGEIVWTINPANDTLANIVAYVRNYLSRMLELNPEIRFKLELPEPSQIPQDLAVNPELKRNLILIVKEALTNILKHSKATEVEVRLTTSESEITLVIRDNGRGLAKNENGKSGNGLQNMKSRAIAIKAKFDIISTSESGTAIHLTVPVG